MIPHDGSRSACGASHSEFLHRARVYAGIALGACGKDSGPTEPPPTLTPASCPDQPRRAARGSERSDGVTVALHVFGTARNGSFPVRSPCAALCLHHDVECSPSWGNKINIWDVSGNVPVLVDSVIVTGALQRETSGERRRDVDDRRHRARA